MKQVLRLSAVVGLMTLGFASQAQAVVSLQVIGCQGVTCVSSAVIVAPAGNFATAVVGDYTVTGQVGVQEGAGQSQAALTTIQVSRLTTNSANPLDVYVVATNYNLPNPPGSMNSTHGVTYVNNNPPGNTAGAVAYAAWYVPGNIVLPVPNAPVTIPGTATAIPALSCTPIGDPVGSCDLISGSVPIVGGITPFTLITQTRFNIGTAAASLNDTYGTTDQVTVFPGQQPIIPEPASMLLLGTGLVGLARAVRRRRTQ